MAESIFDPRSTQTERSGSTFLGGHAHDHSHMPPDLVDGKVGEREAADLAGLGECPKCPGLPGLIAPFDTIDERENLEQPGTL